MQQALFDTISAAPGKGENNNRLQEEDRAVHDWYRFVLSFPPHLVRTYLNRFGISTGDCVLDPFCGTGTTLVECKKNGISSVGMERVPLSQFVSSVKLDWSANAEDLLAHTKALATSALEKLKADGIEDDGPSLFSNGRKPVERLRTLPDDRMKLLLKGSLSPLPMHKTLVLLDTMQEHCEPTFSKYERLALAKTLAYKVSNLTFGPEVGVGRMKRDAPVVLAWLDAVRVMAADLLETSKTSSTEAKVFLADSRDPMKYLEPHSIDAVITSPPYPNEKDYTRTTRLESVLLGFIKSKHDLREVKQGLVRSNTRSVYKEDADDAYVSDHSKIQQIAQTIEDRRIALGKTSGFERLYGRLAKLYFGGMAAHLANLRPALRSGAHLAYVVGDQASYLRVMIRTGQLLAEIAERLGYEVVNIDLFRTRLATATREQLREEVVVLRWPSNR